MSSAIYILDKDLSVIIQRQYRQDLDSSYILDSFKYVYKKSYPVNIPVLQFDGVTYVYLQKDEVMLMSPVFGDVDIFSHMTFLEKFSQLLGKYFHHYKLVAPNSTVLKADLIKDNYTLIYELFDECTDFGIPQLTEFSILKDYIKLMIKPEDYYDGSHFSEDLGQVEKQMETEINSSISRTAMTKISWRPKGIFYNKNEFFINFNEFLKFKYNRKIHKVVLNQISGAIDCKSYLSGMPDLKLGLNETLDRQKTIFNNIQYHQCVNLNLLNSSTIEFIPPDGEFNLLHYQILDTQVLRPLILIKPKFRIFAKHGSYKLRIKIEMVTTFKRKFSMIDVKIRVPLIIKHPTLYINFNHPMKFKTKLGDVVHSLDDESLIWKIEKIQGSMRGEMLAEFELITEKDLCLLHEDNVNRGKQERNDLFYFDLGSEFTKLGNEKLSSKKINSNQILDENGNAVSKFKYTTKKEILNSDIERIVTVEFQLQNMLYSGLKVEFLTIKEDQLKLQTFPWIMYCVYSRGDDYSFVLGDEEFINDLGEEENRAIIENGKWLGRHLDEDNDADEIEGKGEEHADFSTALDHISDMKITASQDLNFEEYMVDGEENNT